MSDKQKDNGGVYDENFTRRNISNPMRKIKNKDEEKLSWKILGLNICMI